MRQQSQGLEQDVLPLLAFQPTDIKDQKIIRPGPTRPAKGLVGDQCLKPGHSNAVWNTHQPGSRQAQRLAQHRLGLAGNGHNPTGQSKKHG